MAIKNKALEKDAFSSISILFFLWRWKKILLIITGATVIISTVFSLLITPLYESRVILFPTATNSISKVLISDNYGGRGIMEFGEEEQTEQLLQVLSSSLIRDRIVEKYDLFSHYKINPDVDLYQRYLYYP